MVLGGVHIDHAPGLAGHSDADAVLHAIIDSVLGAIAAGDIGEHVPDADPMWLNADSAHMLLQVMRIAADRGYKATNCDVTVIAETPKLSRHKPAMRTRIAQLLGVGTDAVSVKAKTNEGMGWIGRGEGLAAMAVVTLTTE